MSDDLFLISDRSVVRDMDGFDASSPDGKLYIRVMAGGDIVGSAEVPLVDIKDRASEYGNKL